MARTTTKTSRGQVGTLQKKLLLIPKEVKWTCVLPAVNAVTIEFVTADGSRAMIRRWEFDTATEARAHYGSLPVK